MVRKKRNKFFDDFAARNSFDPLVTENWCTNLMLTKLIPLRYFSYVNDVNLTNYIRNQTCFSSDITMLRMQLLMRTQILVLITTNLILYHVKIISLKQPGSI